MTTNKAIKDRAVDFATCFGFIVLAGGFSPQLGQILQANSDGTGSIRYQLFWIALYGVFIYLSLDHNLKRGLTLFPAHIFFPILLLVCWTLSSCLWSASPLTSLRNALGLVGTLLMGYGTALIHRNAMHIIDLLYYACILSAIFSLLLMSQTGGIDGYGDGMEGIFSHKNGLGQLMSLGTLITIYKIASDFNVKLVFALALFVEVLILSQSVTAQVSAFLASTICVIAYIFTRGGKTGKQILGLFITTIILFLFLVYLYLTAKRINPGVLLISALGKNTTFTGRTSIWKVSIESLDGMKLFIGYGFNSFWSTLGEANVARSLVGFRAFNSHNGYIELTLSLGLVGLFLYVFLIVNLFRSALETSKFYPLAVSFVIWILTVNTMESAAWAQNSLLTQLIVLIPNMIYLAREREQSQVHNS
jgi:exopolysaccharide production protein ExoQ